MRSRASCGRGEQGRRWCWECRWLSRDARCARAGGVREGRADELLRSYQHGTDDAPAVVAREIARLPTPYAIALTAAIAEQLDEFERLEFTNLLFEVATGKYRSVFDRAGD